MVRAMTTEELGRTLDGLQRDLDLLVYALEAAGPESEAALRAERRRTRRELERLSERMGALLRQL